MAFFKDAKKKLERAKVGSIDIAGSLKPRKVQINKSGRIADGILYEAKNINVRI